MKIPSLLVASSFLLCQGLTAPAEPLIQPHDTVAICGDSITAQHLYSAYLEDYLLMCAPQEGLNIVQFGWSGEQATGFFRRLEGDILPFKPTVATITYGMNDGLYKALTENVSNTYRKAQTDAVEKLKKNGVKTIILGSSKGVDSYYFHKDQPGTSTPEVYNQTLSALADIDKDIAAKEGIVYADVFGSTMDAMKKAKAQYGEDYAVNGKDGVHPEPNGHLVMAYAFLKALGYDGAIATISVDLEHNMAKVTKGQEVVSLKDGTLELKSTRYPFCFIGSPKSTFPKDTTSILKSVPFNEDLNRYLLVVKGLKTAKAKVTWGTESKEFNAADLDKGVNLAAEFIDNPFHAQFLKIHNLVLSQQYQEQVLVQSVIHRVPDYLAQAPSAADALNAWKASNANLRDAFFKAACDLVTPVQHTIRVEPLTVL